MPPTALTPGEPAGIGPDIVVHLACTGFAAPVVVIADPELLASRAKTLGVRLRIEEFAPGGTRTPPVRAGVVSILPVPLVEKCDPGKADPANASYVLDTLRGAARGCLDKTFSALVTGPVHKGVINAAGIHFSGHTEFLGDLAGSAQPVMMLVAPGLRVALATTHLSLSDVSRAITAKRLENVIRVLINGLSSQFGIAEPRVSVCGLNPHAGEDGHLGREEIEIIAPLLDRLRSEGMRLEGPLPADTIFTPPVLARTDAVLAMYHDQGLPTLKHLGFKKSVNVTLGLPFVRTSVDHGTAFALAGSGSADAGSLHHALELACTLARGRWISSH